MKYKPMLAKIGKHTLLDDKDLIFEPKVDGYRALCEVSPEGMKFFSRNGHDITPQFPEFQFRKTINAKHCILDGEIIVDDRKGFPNFNLLQGRSQLTDPAKIAIHAKKYPAHYAVFDILSKNCKELIKEPFIKRNTILHETVKPMGNIELLSSTHEGKKLFAQMKKNKLEGVIAKDPNGIYAPGKRTNAWQKVKLLKSIECVILGYTQEKKLISSLLLGLYDKEGNLTYIGRTGTGFSQEKIDELYPKLLKQKVAKSAVKNIPTFDNVHYVRPKIVGEVKYLEQNKSGTLRHSSYMHVRDDKSAKDCTFDQF